MEIDRAHTQHVFKSFVWGLVLVHWSERKNRGGVKACVSHVGSVVCISRVWSEERMYQKKKVGTWISEKQTLYFSSGKACLCLNVIWNICIVHDPTIF